MVLNSLYIKLGFAALICLSIGYHIYKDVRTERALADATEQNLVLKQKLKQTEQNLIEATQQKEKLSEKIDEAEKQREKIRADLNDTLKKLRGQKLPSDCSKLNLWLVDNKDDLKW